MTSMSEVTALVLERGSRDPAHVAGPDLTIAVRVLKSHGVAPPSGSAVAASTVKRWFASVPAAASVVVGGKACLVQAPNPVIDELVRAWTADNTSALSSYLQEFKTMPDMLELVGFDDLVPEDARVLTCTDHESFLHLHTDIESKEPTSASKPGPKFMPEVSAALERNRDAFDAKSEPVKVTLAEDSLVNKQLAERMANELARQRGSEQTIEEVLASLEESAWA